MKVARCEEGLFGRIANVFLSLVLACSMCVPVTALAVEPSAADEDDASVELLEVTLHAPQGRSFADGSAQAVLLSAAGSSLSQARTESGQTAQSLVLASGGGGFIG